MAQTSPIPLTGEAAAFWTRHHGRLVKRGILTDADLDSFALLCVTWQRLCELQGIAAGADNFREMVQFTNLNKQYQALAKQFGLLPRDRRSAKMDGDAPRETDEFGL